MMALPPKTQAQQVHQAELQNNLNTCMTGMYPALCNHSLLTPAQAQQVHQTELRHQTASGARSAVPEPSQTYQRPYRGYPRGDCQSGLSILAVVGDGKVIKLSDGSIWEVDDVDTVDTALWLPASDPQRSPKTGQWLSPENRPTRMASGTLTPAGVCSLRGHGQCLDRREETASFSSGTAGVVAAADPAGHPHPS